MLRGSWYLRTSPLSALYVCLLLAFEALIYFMPICGFISFRSCVDPDISGHLHCRSFTSIYSYPWSISNFIGLPILRGPWYLRTSPLSELYVYLLLALIYIQFLLAFRYCVDPDISGHLHCQSFRHYVHLRCQSCVDPYCKDISTVGHHIPMLRGPWYIRTSPLSEIRHYVHFWCQFCVDLHLELSPLLTS
jgi:hypothetical protein